MTVDPVCCLPTDTVEEAAQIMKDEVVGSVPVVESHETRRLVGIVTDRDLTVDVLAEGRSGTTTVESVMTGMLATCRADDDVECALELMGEYQVRRIPIVDDQNQIVGIIAQADVATRIDDPEETAEVLEEISQGPARETSDASLETPDEAS
jgi:CBS domain-containing protein